MARVGPIDEPISCQLDAPIEDTYFIRPSAAFPDATTDLELNILSELLFVVIQIGICTKSRKVVAVNDDTGISSLVIEAARRRCACHKTDRLESAPLAEFPDVTSVTTTIRKRISPISPHDWGQGTTPWGDA